MIIKAKIFFFRFHGYSNFFVIVYYCSHLMIVSFTGDKNRPGYVRL